jgi:choline kinase/predicted GNAT family N-acyltransferase
MKAIILAAGEGKRLNRRPKALIEIEGKYILQRQIDLLNSKNIEVTVVTGCYRKEIESSIVNANFIYNKNYKKENCISLRLALKKLIESGTTEDILVMDGDIVYEESLLNQMIEQTTTSYLIDFNKKSPDDMGVIIDSNKISGFSKEGVGSGVGIVFIANSDIITLYNKLLGKDKTWWINHLPVELINFVSAKKGAKWIEIDTEDDLRKAKALFEINVKLDNDVTVSELFNLMNEMNFKGFHLDKRNDIMESKALKNCVSFSIRHNGRMIGYARVFGDLVYYWSIWDVMILPEYQGYGLGYELMKVVLDYIKKFPYIKIFLFSAEGKENFYSQFGFKKTRANVMEVRND